MARDHRDLVERALRAEEGRERADARRRRPRDPSGQRARGRLLPRAHARPSSHDRERAAARARVRARRPCAGPRRCPSPTSRRTSSFVALRDARRVRDRGRAGSLSSGGLDVAPRRVRRALRRGAGAALDRAARPPARRDGAYLVGPLARYALNRDRLSPLAREAAGAAGLEPVCRNPFRSIVVRCVEVLHAVDEALRLIDAYEPPDPPARRRAAARRRRLRLDRGAARAAVAPLRARRRRDDPRRADRPAHVAEPGAHRAEPAPLRRAPRDLARRGAAAGAASRPCAATTRASPARRTSCGWRSTAGDARRASATAWRGDDAAGLEVARRAGGVEHEGDATRLLDAWAGADDVVVVDAAASGAPPGTLRWFDASAAPLPAAQLRSSTHAFGVADAIELARALGAPARPACASTRSRAPTSRSARR